MRQVRRAGVMKWASLPAPKAMSLHASPAKVKTARAPVGKFLCHQLLRILVAAADEQLGKFFQTGIVTDHQHRLRRATPGRQLAQQAEQ